MKPENENKCNTITQAQCVDQVDKQILEFLPLLSVISVKKMQGVYEQGNF